MIHAYAIEPALLASWCKHSEHRFVRREFGLGTPRALLELPSFSKWKKAVMTSASRAGVDGKDATRLMELLRLVEEARCRRSGASFDGGSGWLESAEAEYDREPFAAILATANPRGHRAVLHGEGIGERSGRWDRPNGVLAERTAHGIASAVDAMVRNAVQVHVVDPHFGPGNPRHRDVLLALLEVAGEGRSNPIEVRVHCSDKEGLGYFESQVARWAYRVPAMVAVSFRRWRTKRDRLHNRYILTELGGVSFGDGIDAGGAGQCDNVTLLEREQYLKWWSVFDGEDGSLERVDQPRPVLAGPRTD